MSTGDLEQNLTERDQRWRFLKLEDKLDRVNLVLDAILQEQQHIQLLQAALLEELASQRKEIQATSLDARAQRDPEDTQDIAS